MVKVAAGVWSPRSLPNASKPSTVNACGTPAITVALGGLGTSVASAPASTVNGVANDPVPPSAVTVTTLGPARRAGTVTSSTPGPNTVNAAGVPPNETSVTLRKS